MDITRLSIDRPNFLAVFYIILLVAGIVSFRKLNYELVPQFNPPVITVVTVYPGASSSEVEQEVTMVIEDALSTIENVETMTSTSGDNFSLVKLELHSQAHVDDLLMEASRKVMTVSGELPSGSKLPVISRFDFNDLPIIRLAVFSSLDLESLTSFCNDKVIPGLSQLKGVADVSISGGVEKEILVDLDARLMEITNTTILQVLKVLGENNVNVPAGSIQSGQRQWPVQYKGRFTSLEEIKNLIILEHPQYGKLIRLRDIAEVYETYKPRETITRLNGRPAIGINIKKQRDANAVEVSEMVTSKLAELEDDNPAYSLKFEFIQDTSAYTLEASRAVGHDLLMVILLVSLVMLIFIHSFKSALVVFVSIPISIITTFLVMNLAGYTLNLMTLLGLSLAIGILVDDSIVILENINRHLKMGKLPSAAAYDGRMEIGFTAVVITLLDVIVFVPVIFSFGMVSELLRPFAVVLVTSTLMSLLVSFTVVPFLASRIKDSKKEDWFARVGAKTEEVLDNVLDGLLRLLNWCLVHPRLVLTVSFLLLVLSFTFIPLGFIGIEFTKAGDRSEFIIELETDNNSTIEVTDRLCKQVEEELRKFPDVQSVYSNVGITSSGRIETNMSHLGEIFIKLVPPEERKIKTSQFARLIKYHLMSTIPGINIRPVEINIIGLRDDDAVQVTLTGENPDSLSKASAQVLTELDNLQGAIEAQSNQGGVRRSFSVIPDREIMESLDINLAQAGITLRTAIHGNDGFRFIYQQKKLPLQVKLNSSERNEVRDLQRLTVLNTQGKTVPFFEFSTINETKSIEKRERTNRAPSVTIKSQVFGKPAGSVSNHLKQRIEEFNIPPGINFIWGGATRRTSEGLSSLVMSFSISVFLIFFLLVILYDSFTSPLIILLTIPLALIGALFSLAMSMEAFSIFTVLGLIILIGLVGKNAILLVDFTRKFRKLVPTAREAVIEAVKVRFKPIVMTNLTMIIGLFPIALARGAGAEWKNGMAWALIGGLSSSMILTFIVIPVVYQLFDRFFSKKDTSVVK